MGHEISNNDVVGIVGDRGWHGLGNIINPGYSAIQAAEHLKMVEPIFGRPIFWQDASGQYHAVDSHVANVQAVENEPVSRLLGIVGADYSVCQNRELAEFTDALAQTGQVQIETCGTIRNGKRVWFLAKGESFNIGDRDTVHTYVLVSNAHDGTQAIRVTPTTVRVVCSNTLHMVVPQGDDMCGRPETAAISIRHSGKIADKLEQAKRALAYYGETTKRNRDLFEMMQAKQLDQDATLQLFADSYAAFWEVATPEELSSEDAKIKATADNRMNRMQKASQAFLSRLAAENKQLNLGNTAWAVFNAV